MGLKQIRQTVTTESTQTIDGFEYFVVHTNTDDVLVSISIRFFKEDPTMGKVECGTMNRDCNNTYINILSGEDVFLHSGILADICKEIEADGTKKK